MLSARRAALIGVLTLLLGLLLFFPARIAYQWIAPPTVLLSGIDGSVWNGSSSEASVGGLYLGNLRWKVRPLRLFRGELAFAITAKPASGLISGSVGVAIGGTYTVSNLQAEVSLQSLQSLLNNPGLSGSMRVELDELTGNAGGPVSATGSFDIVNLINPSVTRDTIGGYRGEISSDDSGFLVLIEETDGIVDIDGRLTIAMDHSYRFIALLAPNARTPVNLRQFMERLPLADNGVRRVYQFDGRM